MPSARLKVVGVIALALGCLAAGLGVGFVLGRVAEDHHIKHMRYLQEAHHLEPILASSERFADVSIFEPSVGGAILTGTVASQADHDALRALVEKELGQSKAKRICYGVWWDPTDVGSQPGAAWAYTLRLNAKPPPACTGTVGMVSFARTLPMRALRPCCCIALLTLLLLSGPALADVPAEIASAPCAKPPSIDGVIDPAEWQAAKPLEFELNLVSLKPLGTENRKCEFRAMNSANALYLALRVPDKTQNQSLAPFDVDFALVAFCRGEELAAGDDRKGLAPGFYLDKHVVSAGKDADDAQRDGRGASVYRDGVYTFEWAIPLNSGDKQDVQAKPGDALKFNVGYLDSFKLDLQGTKAGGLYGPELDKAGKWGKLLLAKDVTKDDGSAFGGPAWLADVLKTTPAGRLKLTESEGMNFQGAQVGKGHLEFTFRDPQGKPQQAHARIYVPSSAREKNARLPLFFAAGYEINDPAAHHFLNQGMIVVTPAKLPANPLARTPNPDVALLHAVRSLACVDDARVVIGGGSAGGYMTLMLAAETFPLAGAAPDVPPCNLGYNAAVYLRQRTIITKPEPAARMMPALVGVLPILESTGKVYGDDTNNPEWYAHSPMAHLDRITAPVSVLWTTADVLVPINQIAARLTPAFDPEKFPKGLTFDPAKLCTAEGQRRLLDVLPADRYELFELPLPADAVRRTEGQKVVTLELPFSTTKQWSIAILNEGSPEQYVDHMKYGVLPLRTKFMARAAEGRLDVAQLTAAKLAQLMDRYAGREWLSTTMVHLDEPAAERADVLRGLKTYVAQGAEHARAFGASYDKLPAAQQVLPAEVVRELRGSK